MTHLDSSALASYNSLVDPHLQCYFSKERIRSHLKHAGIINRRGDIISDSEYRTKLVRREHKKHVRQMLAENIVHRAIDMERKRQAQLQREFDTIAKITLVKSVRQSRRRGVSSGASHNQTLIDEVSMNALWLQQRPKSASHHHDIERGSDNSLNRPRVSRVQSAHVNGDRQKKYSSKSPVRGHDIQLNRPKTPNTRYLMPLAKKRARSAKTTSNSTSLNSGCKITMVYYGPHTKIDYDHNVFSPADEVTVMQQHSGGENLPIFKDNLKPGDQFSFYSRRRVDHTFGLSFYIKGLFDSRISTCCEYKHRRGVRLGGERGHFAILSVEGSKPCIQCRFDKEARLKQYDDASKDANHTDEENQKPITISISVSDEPKVKQTPVKIPVRRTSENKYSDEFDESDQGKSLKSSETSDSHKGKVKPRISSGKKNIRDTKPKSTTDTDSTSTDRSNRKPTSTKPWQIIFYTSNIPNASLKLSKQTSAKALIKFSLCSNNKNEETDTYTIDAGEFSSNFEAGEQYSFRANLRRIEKPTEIRLRLDLKDDDDDENDVKWHLSHIELIDPQTKENYDFTCNQWFYPSNEKILKLSDPSQNIRNRKSSVSSGQSATSPSSSSSSSSRSKGKTPTPPRKPSSRSSTSSSNYEGPQRYEIIKKLVGTQYRRESTDSESTNEKEKKNYRITIHPANNNDGEFEAIDDSRIFLRLNNQKKNTYLYEKNSKSCPSFERGKSLTFDISFPINPNEKATKLTIGYRNTDIAAGKWEIEKIILTDPKTNETTKFLCRGALIRDDLSLEAERTFQAQLDESTDDTDQQTTPRNQNETTPKQNSIPSKKPDQQRISSDDSSDTVLPEQINGANVKLLKSKTSEDEDNEYNRVFNKKNSDDDDDDDDSKKNNKNEPAMSYSRPKTRRGRDDTIGNSNNQNGRTGTAQGSTEIWRPPSELDTNEPVDPLVGLDDLQDQTARSNGQKSLVSSTTTKPNTEETPFKNWYPNKKSGDNSDSDDSNE